MDTAPLVSASIPEMLNENGLIFNAKESVKQCGSLNSRLLTKEPLSVQTYMEHNITTVCCCSQFLADLVPVHNLKTLRCEGDIKKSTCSSSHPSRRQPEHSPSNEQGRLQTNTTQVIDNITRFFMTEKH